LAEVFVDIQELVVKYLLLPELYMEVFVCQDKIKSIIRHLIFNSY